MEAGREGNQVLYCFYLLLFKAFDFLPFFVTDSFQLEGKTDTATGHEEKEERTEKYGDYSSGRTERDFQL